ncbi:CLUMA_CG017843, isoform A [Clunio marinus]|uniref:CLUMA_CG017843, isoform A n=1 Tax=Clunio marinus TaxID=568069 RepID=A0A1J1IWX8_9DIPT|nr:CLUMA_CG017843, isoform A [Clunio marinus]
MICFILRHQHQILLQCQIPAFFNNTHFLNLNSHWPLKFISNILAREYSPATYRNRRTKRQNCLKSIFMVQIFKSYKHKTFNLNNIEEEFSNHISITCISHLQARSKSVSEYKINFNILTSDLRIV